MDVVRPAAPPPIMIVSNTLCSFLISIDKSSFNTTLSGLV